MGEDSSLGFTIIECSSCLVVGQQLGRVGKNLAEEPEVVQFGLLIASAMAYVDSAVLIVWVSGCDFNKDLLSDYWARVPMVILHRNG